MTSNGRLLAALLGIAIAFMLPKRVECGYPGAYCGRIVDKDRCTRFDVEPWGFFLIESVVKTNVGFAYSSEEECR